MKLSLPRQRLALAAAMLLWCFLLVFCRFQQPVDHLFYGLIRNLFLAAVPLIASEAFAWCTQQPYKWPRRLCFAIWLLFLPNAPYILTDFIHLRERVPVPLWFDVTIFLSFAGSGLIFGYLSVAQVQGVIHQAYGKAVGWGVALGSLMLCGVGIYLGRFLRWNSWQVLTHPRRLIVTTVQRQHFAELPNPLAVILVYGCGLILGYLALRVLAASMAGESKAK